MATVNEIAGTRTIGTTEWSLADDVAYSSAAANTTNGMMQLVLDMSAMADGDEFEVRCYEKVLSGGTARLMFPPVRYTNVQAAAHATFPGIFMKHGWFYTVKKIAGTDRSISWSIRYQ